MFKNDSRFCFLLIVYFSPLAVISSSCPLIPHLGSGQYEGRRYHICRVFCFWQLLVSSNIRKGNMIKPVYAETTVPGVFKTCFTFRKVKANGEPLPVCPCISLAGTCINRGAVQMPMMTCWDSAKIPQVCLLDNLHIQLDSVFSNSFMTLSSAGYVLQVFYEVIGELKCIPWNSILLPRSLQGPSLPPQGECESECLSLSHLLHLY